MVPKPLGQDLFADRVQIVIRIVFANADETKQALPDRADGLAVDFANFQSSRARRGRAHLLLTRSELSVRQLSCELAGFQQTRVKLVDGGSKRKKTIEGQNAHFDRRRGASRCT
jgi:hypothetical protein